MANWRSNETGQAKSLFNATHTAALTAMTFKELCRRVEGADAVTAIAKEVLEEHRGDVSKLGVMKLVLVPRSKNVESGGNLPTTASATR